MTKNVICYGTKKVSLLAMTRLEYNQYRGWDLPSDEDGNDAGYLVEYLDGGKPNHAAHKGYISWSPMEQAEAAYQPSTAMSFGHALVAAFDHRERIARAGWNGKEMFVYAEKGIYDVTRHGGAVINGVPVSRFNAGFAGTSTRMPYLIMRAADGSFVTGWLASQSDMAAHDWQIVHPEE